PHPLLGSVDSRCLPPDPHPWRTSSPRRCLSARLLISAPGARLGRPAPRAHPRRVRLDDPAPTPRCLGGTPIIHPPPSIRLLLAVQPAAMRRGFDGLAALTSQVLHQDPLSGHLFVFRNRRGDRLKILYWDRDGLAVWAKKQE